MKERNQGCYQVSGLSNWNMGIILMKTGNREDGGSSDQEGKDVNFEECNVIHATLIITY